MDFNQGLGSNSYCKVAVRITVIIVVIGVQIVPVNSYVCSNYACYVKALKMSECTVYTYFIISQCRVCN